MGTLRARLDGEHGFTLIELIAGMAISALIMGSIASALIVSFRTSVVTQQRMAETHDAAVSSAYLANDVQSAASVDVATGGTACNAGSPTRLVTFTYATGGAAVYNCGVSGGETQVSRTFAGASTIVAHFAGAARPTIACTPSPCTSTPLDSVSIAFATSGGYSYTLLGSRRALNPSGTPGGGGTADATLFVLGGGSPLWVSGSCPPGQIDNQGNPNNTCTADSESGGGQPTTPKLTVIGNLLVNSPTTGAVRISGKKNAVKLVVQGGDFKILSPGTCSGCTTQTVQCAACGYTPPGSYSVPLLDPLRFMTAPVETGLPHFTDGNYHGPGVYDTRTLSISSNTTFASGVYILNNGISLTGSATISGNGVTLFNKSGGISFGGSSTVALSPPTSGQYKGILIFQPITNPTALNLAGGTGVSPIGIIYAPMGSSVTLGTGSANLRVTAVIAQNIKVSGSAQVTIG